MRLWAAAVTDVVGIAIFATIGRVSHGEAIGPFGVASTAWPFLAGWAAGALAGRAWRRPEALSTGVAVWAGTLAGGMLLRFATGAGVAPSFVVVAGLVLAALLLGWRGIVALLHRGRRPVAATAGARR